MLVVIISLLYLGILGTFLYFTLLFAYRHLDDSDMFIRVLSWIWMFYGSIGGSYAAYAVIKKILN